jgi:hypothetical protein
MNEPPEQPSLVLRQIPAALLAGLHVLAMQHWLLALPGQ